MADTVRVVVSDANVLINLIYADRLALLGSLRGYEFIVPDEVLREIVRRAQRQAVRRTIGDGCLRRAAIDDPGTIALFAALREVR